MSWQWRGVYNVNCTYKSMNRMVYNVNCTYKSRNRTVCREEKVTIAGVELVERGFES